MQHNDKNCNKKSDSENDINDMNKVDSDKY